MKKFYCGELSINNVGQDVILNGWTHSKRDHGGVIFFDLRDIKGIVQIVINPELSKIAENIKNEYVVQVKGKVRKRPPGTENPNLKTGQIEVVAEQIQILNTSKTPPFEVSEFSNVSEEVRLKYRYLDLRRPQMKENLIIRHRIIQNIRNFLTKEGYIEIETPFLTKSTPEGARDFLVPSRLHPQNFYALPQSPQLFKQILMISGFDKYFQIVRCFRDEDLRADRQPEFTQVDLEISFCDENDIMDITERFVANVFKEILNKQLQIPFQKITYQTAIEKYLTDKPDTRNPIEIFDVTEIFINTNFEVFKNAINSGFKIRALRIPNASKLSRTEIDNLVDLAKSHGAPGLAWTKLQNEKFESGIGKFFSEKELSELKKIFKENDLAFFSAFEEEKQFEVINNLKNYIEKKMNLIKKDDYNFIWITDFPLFEWDETEKRWSSVHHPFTSPKDEFLELIEEELKTENYKNKNSKLKNIKSKAYDLILNGVELGGGSIRIHKRDLQEKIFSLLQIPQEEYIDRFGFLLEALEYGAPPHGGIALGLDRFVALIVGEDSIRDTIAFPKTQRGICPLTSAPQKVSQRQLKELDIIKIIK